MGKLETKEDVRLRSMDGGRDGREEVMYGSSACQRPMSRGGQSKAEQRRKAKQNKATSRVVVWRDGGRCIRQWGVDGFEGAVGQGPLHSTAQHSTHSTAT